MYEEKSIISVTKRQAYVSNQYMGVDIMKRTVSMKKLNIGIQFQSDVLK